MRRGAGAIAAGAVMVAAAAGIALWALSMGRAASAPDPSCGSEPAANAAADDGFAVDWERWREINPDVCGWVRVPGTGVSQPIAAASPEDPAGYLTHDVYGNWNVYGCPYLDAECKEGLLGSRMAVVSGHHMDDGSMFSELSSYEDAGWAADHAWIDLYAPGEDGSTVHERRAVACARAVGAGEEAKRTAFASGAELSAWLSDQAQAGIEVGETDGAERAVALVTCSTFTWDAHRDVVFATTSVPYPSPDPDERTASL